MAFRFEKLDIWKDAIAFAIKVYKTTKTFPREELFSLVDQLRRAVASISANIAEGLGYISEKTKNELYADADILTRKIRALQNSVEKNS